MKTLKILFYTFVTIMILLAGISLTIVLLMHIEFNLSPQDTNYFESTIILLAFIGIPGTHYLHKKRISTLPSTLQIANKLSHYKNSFLIKLATIEGLSVLTLITYILTSRESYLYIFGIYLVTVLINYPSPSKIAEELNCEPSELN